MEYYKNFLLLNETHQEKSFKCWNNKLSMNPNGKPLRCDATGTYTIDFNWPLWRRDAIVILISPVLWWGCGCRWRGCRGERGRWRWRRQRRWPEAEVTSTTEARTNRSIKALGREDMVFTVSSWKHKEGLCSKVKPNI